MKCFTFSSGLEFSEGILVERTEIQYERGSISRSPGLPELVKVAGGVRVIHGHVQLMENETVIDEEQVHASAVVYLPWNFCYKVEGARCLYGRECNAMLIYLERNQFVKVQERSGNMCEPLDLYLSFDGKQLRIINHFVDGPDWSIAEILR